MLVKVTDWKKFGRRVKALRAAKGLSQEQLAEPEYSAAYISHLEHGKRRASQEALAHIADRLEVTVEQLVSGRDPHADLRLEIEIQQAVAQVHAGEPAEARDRLLEAIEEATESGNVRAALRAEEGLGLAYYRSGEIELALGAFLRAESAAADRTPEERTAAITGKARCLFKQGDVREAIHELEQHLIQLRASEAPDPSALVATFAALIPPYFETGMIERAKAIASEGWRLAPQAGDPDQKACLFVNRAQLLLTQGEPREALVSLALAEDLFRQLGWFSEVAKVTLAKAYALTETGELPAAEELLMQALHDPGATSRSDKGQAIALLAQIRRLQGDAKEGLRLATEALKIAGRDFPIVAAESNRQAGLSSQALGDDGSAMVYWRKALKLYKNCCHNEEIARTSRLIGDALTAAGDLQGAVKAYREGLGSVEELR